MSFEAETWASLKGFYNAIAASSGLTYGQAKGIHYVMHPGQNWPSYLLGGEHLSEPTIEQLALAMQKGELPRFWIRAVSPGKSFDARILKYNIKQVGYWSGMWLKRDKPYGKLVPDPGCMLDRITGEHELREWLNVVNHEVMSEKNIDYRLFRDVLTKPEFDFFRIVKGKKTVSTLLGFRAGAFIGLYMISTKNDFRDRGYGSWITSEALDYYIRKGFCTFVLHSTVSGYPMYKKLGFSENNRFGIYRFAGNLNLNIEL
ncbi:MAG TPA: hypothetical protein VE870_10685 [Bacteroidales bacterium]|nr:hypothetical protein [Bacteroidales bacterium]